MKKKQKWKLVILLTAACLSFLFFAAKLVHSVMQPDKQCLMSHEIATQPPTQLKTAKDYFALANYNYDRGDCNQAIRNYTLVIQKDNNFAEAYNNRAYTYLRMTNYEAALPDLDRAIALRPNYVNALMNRGDMYNYYYHIDRKKALEDYNKVLTLVPPERYRELSLCGHRLLAQNNGWRIPVFLSILTKGYNAGCN